MAIQIDNKISWPDIVAIGSSLAMAGVLFFDVKEEVSLNTQHIHSMEDELRSDIRRIEKEADSSREEILEAIKDVKDDSKEGLLRVESKIDRLIERELNED